MRNNNTLIIDNMEIPIEGERNLLEVIRKAKIDLPTFCYHSEMSIYGACRLVITSYSIHYTKLYDGWILSNAL